MVSHLDCFEQSFHACVVDLIDTYIHTIRYRHGMGYMVTVSIYMGRPAERLASHDQLCGGQVMGRGLAAAASERRARYA